MRECSPTSHFVLSFSTLLTFAPGVTFSVAGMNVSVVAFAFQLAGVDVVAAMFAGVSVTGSVCLVVYEVVAMRETRLNTYQIQYIPRSSESPLRQPVFISVARVSHWPCLAS